jgi:hypothetical protein
MLAQLTLIFIAALSKDAGLMSLAQDDPGLMLWLYLLVVLTYGLGRLSMVEWFVRHAVKGDLRKDARS